MGKNIIVSEDTIRDLLEAHASLSAWYYVLSAGLRLANAPAKSPDDATRAAFVERLVADFPEVATVARTIKVPRMFVPPPPPTQNPPKMFDENTEEQSTVIEPAPQRLRDSGMHKAVTPAAASPEPRAEPAVAPPGMVNPDKVKYEP